MNTIGIAFLAFLLAITQITAYAAGVPSDLANLVQDVEAGEVNYPGRASDMRQLEDFRANGDFDMAAFVARKIIKQQENLRSAQGSGVPADLVALLREIDATAIDYPARASDMRQLEDFRANGDFEMAAFVARKIIKQQENLRSAQGSGVPADLVALLREIDATAIDYPARASDMRQLEDFRANGDFEMAAFVARKIIKQQENLRSAQGSGVPADLVALLREIDATAIDYPARASDMRQLEEFGTNGDFEMAAFVARKIIKQQENLRSAKGGAPPVVKDKPALPESKTNQREQLPDNNNAGFDVGIEAYKRGAYTNALREFRPLAEQGHADAQFNLGAMYELGQGVRQSDTEAAKWYRKSAMQGQASAQFQLGQMYAKGEGVPKSDTEAVKWYRQAAAQGDALGQNKLVILQHKLGSMYANGEGVKQSDSEAANWYSKAAKRGFAPAQAQLGSMYAAGKGVSKDMVLSYVWFSMAATGGEKQSPYLTRDIIAATVTAAKQGRDLVASALTGAQKAEAQRLTTICRDNLGDCPVRTGEAPRAAGQRQQSPAPVTRDTIAPVIDIPSVITVESDSPTVRGRVTDNGKVAKLAIEDSPIGIAADGSFSFTRYVPGGGTTVRIEATDEWGNRSEKVVQLSRDVAKAAAPVFVALDPTGFAVKESKDAVAVIIGIANYKRTAQAQYADRDANFFADYAHRKLGVPEANIKVLTEEQADRSDIIEAIRVWLPAATQAGKSDIYVFFAGHGLGSDDGKEIYLLPYNGVPDILEDTALLRSELFTSLEAVQPRSVTVFLDTCYSGTSRDATLMAARPVRLVAKVQSIPEGFTVFSAASMEQTAKMLPEAEHGLFSYYLMKGMEGAADANGDRQITAGELHEYILTNATRLQRNQTPQLHGDSDQVLVRW